MNSTEIEKAIVQSYSDEYCFELEAAYGPGMMSEGGVEAIESLFEDIDLAGTLALDIGSGLGGVAYYLAEHRHCRVIGLEISPWMVQTAKEKTPMALRSKVDFVVKPEGSRLPFEDHSFDIVYSKGVFTHIPDKQALFSEIFRLLKPQGKLVITDWLSNHDNHWGPLLSEMATMEDLTLFAITPSSYKRLLQEAGFGAVTLRDESALSARYNHAIVQRLQSPAVAEGFIERFSREKLQASIKGYRLIAQAIETGELLVTHITATKG